MTQGLLTQELSQEQENQAFERLLEEYGAYRLEEKIQRLEWARKYYRKYPYDAWSKRAGMDAIDLVHPSDPLKEIIADEMREELLNQLTERELWVALKAEEGYKPRDMAALRGVETSGADRVAKHSAKQKMKEKLATDSNRR